MTHQAKQFYLPILFVAALWPIASLPDNQENSAALQCSADYDLMRDGDKVRQVSLRLFNCAEEHKPQLEKAFLDVLFDLQKNKVYVPGSNGKVTWIYPEGILSPQRYLHIYPDATGIYDCYAGNNSSEELHKCLAPFKPQSQEFKNMLLKYKTGPDGREVQLVKLGRG